MEDNKKNKSEHKPLGTEGYGKFRTGAGVTKEDIEKSATDPDDIKVGNRAKMDGNDGKFESERLQPTETDSDLPGSDEKNDIGTAASGAGLGGNRGRGTANSD